MGADDPKVKGAEEEEEVEGVTEGWIDNCEAGAPKEKAGVAVRVLVLVLVLKAVLLLVRERGLLAVAVAVDRVVLADCPNEKAGTTLLLLLVLLVLVVVAVTGAI